MTDGIDMIYNENETQPFCPIKLIRAKICALVAHIQYDLCTKGHLNNPT